MMCMLTQMLLYTHQYIHTLSNSVLQLENLKLIHDPCDNQQSFWWAANSGMPSSSHRVEPWLHSCSCLQQLALSVILVCIPFCFYHCSPISSSSYTSAVGWNLTVHPSTDATQLNGNSCDVLWVNHFHLHSGWTQKRLLSVDNDDFETIPSSGEESSNSSEEEGHHKNVGDVSKVFPLFSSSTLSEPWPSLTGWFQSCWVVSAFWYNSSRSTNTPRSLIQCDLILHVWPPSS